jgi:hypothetical protein
MSVTLLLGVHLAWEFAARTHTHTHTHTFFDTAAGGKRGSRVASKMPHVYDFNTKSCRQQSEVLENGNFMSSSLSMVNLQNQHNSISLRLKNITF